jgi:hypothetical protein
MPRDLYAIRVLARKLLRPVIGPIGIVREVEPGWQWTYCKWGWSVFPDWWLDMNTTVPEQKDFDWLKNELEFKGYDPEFVKGDR